MKFREIIQRWRSNPVGIYDSQGIEIPASRIREEYQALTAGLQHVKSGRVALKLPRDYRYLLSIIACLEMNLTYIPLRMDFPEDRIKQILEDTHFTFLLDDQKFDELIKDKHDSPMELKALSNPIAYIMFTSGSTGRPKGVAISRAALENAIISIHTVFPNVDSKDKLIQLADFTFDLSLVDVILYLTKGVRIYFSDFCRDVFRLAHEIEIHKITIINSVPSTFSLLLDEAVISRANFSSLKYATVSGSRFSLGLWEKCRKTFSGKTEVWNFYGPTESTIISHVRKLTFIESSDIAEGSVSIGKPLPGIDSSLSEKNEILLGGAQLMNGYVSAGKIIEFTPPYHTGDLSFMDADGNYFVVGRTDETLKRRGYRINLLDIDSYISRVPGVQSVLTVAVPIADHEFSLVSWIVLQQKMSEEDLLTEMKKYLLNFQLPNKIKIVPGLPLNSSGKIDRKLLLDRAKTELENE